MSSFPLCLWLLKKQRWAGKLSGKGNQGVFSWASSDVRCKDGTSILLAIAPLPWAKWEHLVNVGKSCFKLCIKLCSKLHTFVRCCWRPILPRCPRCCLSTGQVDLESVSVKGTHLNIISWELSQLNSYFLYNVNAVLIFREFLCVCCWVFLVLFLVFFVGFVCLFLNKYS